MNSIIDKKQRRTIIRLSLVVVWIGLGVLLFLLNRGHTLLLDNRNTETPVLTAPDIIKVTIDGKQTLELFRGDRDLCSVGGGVHRLLVEFSGGRPPDGKPSFETRFSLPLGPDMFLVSIPKMINTIEPFIEVFHTQPETRSVDEEPLVSEGGDL